MHTLAHEYAHMQMHIHTPHTHMHTHAEYNIITCDSSSNESLLQAIVFTAEDPTSGSSPLFVSSLVTVTASFIVASIFNFIHS